MLDTLLTEMSPGGFAPLSTALALGIAYLLAIPIGWDREKRDRSAGLRTFPLVAIASCGFIEAIEPRIADDAEALARVVEGLITGIGFIGGGAILKQGNDVRGTATAASLWATGAIGAAIGLGSYDVALIIAVVTLVSLRVLNPGGDVVESPAESHRQTSKDAA
jgi:putative Mg2+ transporter-C (MgtC) family protein